MSDLFVMSPPSSAATGLKRSNCWFYNSHNQNCLHSVNCPGPIFICLFSCLIWSYSFNWSYSIPKRQQQFRNIIKDKSTSWLSECQQVFQVHYFCDSNFTSAQVLCDQKCFQREDFCPVGEYSTTLAFYL